MWKDQLIKMFRSNLLSLGKKRLCICSWKRCVALDVSASEEILVTACNCFNLVDDQMSISWERISSVSSSSCSSSSFWSWVFLVSAVWSGLVAWVIVVAMTGNVERTDCQTQMLMKSLLIVSLSQSLLSRCCVSLPISWSKSSALSVVFLL